MGCSVLFFAGVCKNLHLYLWLFTLPCLLTLFIGLICLSTAIFMTWHRSDYSLPSPSFLPLPSSQSNVSVHARQWPFGPRSLQHVFFACGHNKPELIMIFCDEGILQLEHWLLQCKLFNYYLAQWDVLCAGIQRHMFKRCLFTPGPAFDHAYTVLY